jgi:thiol-disulfide isomerase/thioredoxin
MLMKRILFLLALVLILSACNDKSSFRVNGIINGEKKKYVYVHRVEVDTPVLIDSSKVSKSGRFSFRIKATEADFYQLGFSQDNFITLLAEPGEKIKLTFKGKTLFENYTVTGSEGSLKVLTLDNKLNDTKRQLDSLSTVYQKSSKEPGFELKGPELEAEYKNLIEKQRKFNIEFIIKNLSSMASIKALYQRINSETYVLYEPRDLQYLKIVTDTLTSRYPDSKHVQALAHDFEKEMNQMYMNQLEQMTRDLPQTKLDPVLTDVSGKRIALSSLRGKYALLAFWSVSSKDCIEENLQLKEYYKKYNKRGFEIYQINLDNDEAVWKQAVKFDELPWISTREDDPLDPRNAVLFNVKSLPSNYLFDREGKIIAANLHGRALKVKLEQLFSN